MNRNFKIILWFLLVLVASFFVLRACSEKGTLGPAGEYYFGPPHVSKKPSKKISKQQPPSIQPAKMAIILDDWGNNYALLKSAVALQRPLTLAILPKLPHSSQIAEEAFQGKLGVMLHMPMQPKSVKQKLEPNTIMVTTPDADIVRFLDEALSTVPHAEGANNHMGSAATSDKRVMQAVLGHLKKKNLFFVDSHVIANTVCEPIAKAIGIRFGKRSIFIDNETKLLSIEDQLREAIHLAVTKREVIVIGHDKKVTIEAIQSMLPEIEKAGVRLVYARDLVK